jgi:hypothetical protein
MHRRRTEATPAELEMQRSTDLTKRTEIQASVQMPESTLMLAISKRRDGLDQKPRCDAGSRASQGNHNAYLLIVKSAHMNVRPSARSCEWGDVFETLWRF